MKEIKRFHEGGYGTTEMKLSDYGDWVLYDGHAAIVAALQEQLSSYSMSAGQADQRKSESDTVRVALGFSADADDVAPCDLVDAIAALHEQVRALAAENSKLRDWLISDTMCEVDETAFPATDAAIREIRAQAVEGFADYIALYHSDSKSHALDYAARIRSGE